MIVEPKIARENGIEIDIGFIRQLLLRGGGWFWPSWLIKLINWHRAPRCRCTPLYTAAWCVSAWSRGMGWDSPMSTSSMVYLHLVSYPGISLPLEKTGLQIQYVVASKRYRQAMLAGYGFWMRICMTYRKDDLEYSLLKISLTILYTKISKDTLYCFIH